MNSFYNNSTDELQIQQIDDSFRPQPCFGVQNNQNQFKRSQYPIQNYCNENKQQKMNLKQFYLKQKLALLKIQLKIQSLFSVLQPKIINTKRYGFNNLQNSINPQELVYRQKCLITYSLRQVIQKAFNFVQKRRIKHLSKAFSNILISSMNVHQHENVLQKNKKKISQKRNSQIPRTKSQLDESAFHTTQGLGSSHMSISNVKVKNKELKKVKKNFNQNLNSFYSQFDQILAVHENYLKKKIDQ